MNPYRSIACRVPGRGQGGFTLIEAMITVAVIGILAAVAYPSYQDYVRKGKRATAQAALMELASKEQSYLLDRRVYSAVLADVAFVTPTQIANDYTFTVAVGATPNFTATATPSAALAAKGELTLSVTDTGVKTPANTVGYWGK